MKPKKLINYRSRRALSLFVLLIFISTFFFYLYKPQRVHAQIFLTSGTTWTVPSDWSSSNNTIEVIGGGGGGGGGFSDSSGSGGEGGGGGGGGAYAKITNVTLSPGSTVTVAIGAPGTAGATGASGVKGIPGGGGGDTYLCNATSNCGSITGSAVVVGAKGGSGGDAGFSSIVGASGGGGVASSSVGATRFNGGNGGTGGPTTSGAGGGGGGGGGAAGATANGNNATNPTGINGTIGGQGDGTAGGSGGAANGGTGGTGTEYDGTHGSGGGGGGGNGIGNGSGSPGGAGGNYGGGGAGGGGNGSKHGSAGAGAVGVQGLIRINYTFTSEQDYRWRLDDGNETTGTSLAAEDTAASINYGTSVRLRVSLSNIGSSTTFSYRLEYAPYLGSCSNWTAIPATATTEHFNFYNSAYITDQGATTNVTSGPGVITDPSGYAFTAGKFVSNTSNTATSQTIGAGNFTELEYAIQPNGNATYASYCFRVTTSSGTPLDSYANYPILNINYPPSAPTIYSISNGTTNASRLPIFQVQSTDYNYDPLRYVVEVCSVNSWPCSASTNLTYSTTDACWTSQDVSSPGSSYSSAPAISQAAMAYCSVPVSDMLQPNSTYYMRAKAIDPWGSNTYSPYSSVVSFTTNSLEVQILGNTTINGNTTIGN